jgi:hypothetical protein
MTVSREPGEPVDGLPSRRSRRAARSTWKPRLGPGLVLGVLATIGVVVSMFLSWRVLGRAHPSDIPLAFLFDDTTTAQNPSLLLALIPLAAVLAVGALLPRPAAARVVGGLGVLAVAGLFAFQLHQALDRVPNTDLSDQLDTGFYVAAIAGLVGFLSGFLPSGWTRRRAVHVDDETAAYEREFYR